MQVDGGGIDKELFSMIVTRIESIVLTVHDRQQNVLSHGGVFTQTYHEKHQ
jgi:hypothetical protein